MFSTIPNNSPTGLSLIFLHISIIIISRKCVQTRFSLTSLIAEKIKLSLPHLFIFLYSCIFLFSSLALVVWKISFLWYPPLFTDRGEQQGIILWSYGYSYTVLLSTVFSKRLTNLVSAYCLYFPRKNVGIGFHAISEAIVSSFARLLSVSSPSFPRLHREKTERNMSGGNF